MANTRTELCGACCKGSHPIRKSFGESIVCACGAPFFSQIVVENNLPTNRRCLIKIPMEFMEDHGSRFDETVTLQEKEDSEIHRVKIGGNLFVGFGFEWRDFAQLHDISIGQIIVFTLVARSRFLVQVYMLGNPSSTIATRTQTSVNVGAEQAQTVPPLPVIPKVEEDDDDIEVCVPHGWLVAKALRTKTSANPSILLPSKAKVEKVFLETSSGQAIRTPDIVQKCRIVPNDLEGMDVSDDGIVEASDSSRRKRKFDSEIIHEEHSLRGTTRRALRYEHPVLETPAEDQGGQASPRASSHESTSDTEETGDSDASSDSAWSPGKFHTHHGTKRSAASYAAYNDSNIEEEEQEEEEEEEEDGEDGVEDDQVLNTVIGGKKRSSADEDGEDEMKRKRGRPSMRKKSETDLASADDEMNGTRASGLLVEGSIVKKHGHDWHKPGTKRGRTYVSKRRPVTESEKIKTLKKARQVQLKYPSFLKQLHKDSCYRSLILFPPTQFYRNNMVSATKGSYRTTLVDKEGKSWPTNICGMKIFWKIFTLDHYLEEDDVVVFELLDPSLESVTFFVHIFRVVDVEVTLTGKSGWAINYNVVEGTKKQYFEERRRLAQAQGLKKLRMQKQKQKRKQKQKLKDGSSNPEIDIEFTEFFRGKKKQPSVITEVYKSLSTSQDKSRGLQNEKHASDSPNANQLEDQHRSPWIRPTTRSRSREMNQSSGELNTTPSKSVGSVKEETEDAPPLAAPGNFIGNAVNSVNTEPSALEEIFGREPR